MALGSDRRDRRRDPSETLAEIPVLERVVGWTRPWRSEVCRIVSVTAAAARPRARQREGQNGSGAAHGARSYT